VRGRIAETPRVFKRLRVKSFAPAALPDTRLMILLGRTVCEERTSKRKRSKKKFRQEYFLRTEKSFVRKNVLLRRKNFTP